MKKVTIGVISIFALGMSIMGVAKIVSAATTSSCIITLFGQQYDVTSLQTNHTGRNIFVCGTDMTATYQAQHGTDVTRMLPYLITATPTPTPIATPTSSPTSTPAPTTSPTPSPSSTPAPSSTPQPSPTITPTVSPSPSSYKGHDDEEDKDDDLDNDADEYHVYYRHQIKKKKGN